MKTPESRVNAFLLTLSGLLLGVGFAPSLLGGLAFIGFVPLLVVLERGIAANTGIMPTLRRVYWTFFVFHGVSNWWVSSWQREADPYLMVAGIVLWFGHPLFFALPIVVYRSIRMKFGRAVALGLLPALWTSFEWAHGLGELSYPWQALGYTQIYYTPLVQCADIAGVWGVSFVVVAVNACFAHMTLSIMDAELSETLLMRWAKALYRSKLAFVLLCGIFLAVMSYGIMQMRAYNHTTLINTHTSAAIGIIQPNINPWGKWRGSADEQVALHIRLQDSLRQALPNTHFDAMLWSETAIPYRILLPQNYPFLARVHAWTDSVKTAIITGLPSDVLYTSKRDAPITASMIPRLFDTLYMESFNSATVLTPSSRIIPDSVPQPYPSGLRIHRKMRLTPFAERVPYAEVFSFAVKALTWSVGISGWGLGKEQQTLDFAASDDTVRLGMVICIESIYPDFVARYPALGANLLAVITNDGWFNHTPGPEQHYMIASMRAVETRRYLVRCGNTGISGFITPLGTSLQRTKIDEQIAIAGRVPLLSTYTLYGRFGDWLPQCCTVALVVALLIGIIRSRKYRF